MKAAGRPSRGASRAAAVLVVVAMLAPALVEAACPPPAARSGTEAVNPFVTPFVYAPNATTYEPYRGFGAQVPANDTPQALGTLGAAFDYDSLAAIDNNWWVTDEDINESDLGLEWQAFVFYVSPALSGASSISFTWKGYGAFRSRGLERTYLMAFDFDLARWQVIAETGFSLSVDKLVTGEIVANVSSFVSGNRLVVLTASEQGPPADIGDVGRPGGRPVLTTYLATDYVEVRAFLPTAIPALDLPQSYLNATVAHMTFRGPTIVEESDIVVRSGATLELDHARLIMNGTNASILVEAGGSLRVVNGSLITDSPFDTDDGGGGDRHYWIEVRSGGEFYLENSTIENAGVAGGSLTQRGLYLEDASGALCGAAVVGKDTAVVADGLTNVSVESLRINNSGANASDLQLVNQSTVDATGLNFTRLAISPDSTLMMRTAITVAVVDASAKPIRGADLQMTDDNATAYASSGYGGTDPKTGRVTDFDDNPLPNVLHAVDRAYLGSTTPTFHATVVAAKYFGWSASRPVSAAAPHTESFVMALTSPTFHDAASQLGYDQGARNFSQQDSFGPAVSIVDFNGDGRPDLFVSGGATRGEAETPSASPNRLYRQEAGGNFTDVTDAAGLTSKGANAAAWGDYDNDGDPDLYLVYQGYGTDHALLWAGQANALYRNNGDGTFTNVTNSAGVGERGHGSSAAWGDYDGDGRLDLYVGNIGWVLAWLVRNESSTLYHNNGDGTFTDVSAAMGVNGGVPGRSGANQTLIFLGGDNATELARASAAGSGFVQAVAWIDFDRDGDLDLFLAEDFGASVLYRNDGTTFTLATQSAGLARVGSARGVQVADIDGDGWLDLIQANRWVDFVWRNNRDGTFTDIAPQLGLDEELPGNTPVPLDIDLDGKVDLFVAGGRTSTFHAYAPSYLWHNRGASGFADITASAGVARGNIRSMGAAAADLDGDGDPDIVTANADVRGSLYINDGTGGTWLKVQLTGTASPRDGQGAQVRLVAPGAATGPVQQVGAVGARGSGQGAQLLFGLNGAHPDDAAPWRLDILWTSGVTQSVNVTSYNEVIAVTEQARTTIEPIAPLSVAEDTDVILSVHLSSTDPKVNGTAAVHWTLGAPDGVVLLNGTTPDHTFATPGHFIGTVEFIDRTGATGAATFAVNVLDTTPPSVGAQGDQSDEAESGYTFTAVNVTDNDPQFVSTGSLVWSFVEAGEPVSLSGAQASHMFRTPGDYLVTLTAKDAANNSASTTFTLHITNSSLFGIREVAIIALALAAAVVAALTLMRSRAAKRKAELERGRLEEEERTRPAKDDTQIYDKPKKTKRSKKEMR